MNNIDKLNQEFRNTFNMNNDSDDNFPIVTELTEKEQEAINNMRNTTRQVVVSETGEDGQSVKTPVSDYAKTLDDRIAQINNSDQIKFINSYGKNNDIKKSFEESKEQAKTNAMAAFKTFALNANEVDENDLLAINDEALAALQKHFNIERFDSNKLTSRLHKMSLSAIASILPEKFINIYLTETDIKFNNLKAKEKLLSIIGYLSVTGPEMDYLNEYIEEENKLSLISKRLLQYRLDFAEMLKDETKLSEIVNRTAEIEPMDTSFWSKYIKLPNRVHNEFAQRVVIYEQYKEAYEKIKEEYAGDEAACNLIQEEIDECVNKINIYHDVCDLTLMKNLAETLFERYRNDTKRFTKKFLEKECVDAIERIRRSKVNVSFPGYKTEDKKASKIFTMYQSIYPKMIDSYNKIIANVKAEEEKLNNVCNINEIAVNGYNTKLVVTVFSDVILIIMGRIMKSLTKSPMDKYNAILLDSYFQIFCKMGSDVYIMSEVWDMSKDFIEYTLKTFSSANN